MFASVMEAGAHVTPTPSEIDSDRTRLCTREVSKNNEEKRLLLLWPLLQFYVLSYCLMWNLGMYLFISISACITFIIKAHSSDFLSSIRK